MRLFESSQVGNPRKRRDTWPAVSLSCECYADTFAHFLPRVMPRKQEEMYTLCRPASRPESRRSTSMHTLFRIKKAMPRPAKARGQVLRLLEYAKEGPICRACGSQPTNLAATCQRQCTGHSLPYKPPANWYRDLLLQTSTLSSSVAASSPDDCRISSYKKIRGGAIKRIKGNKPNGTKNKETNTNSKYAPIATCYVTTISGADSACDTRYPTSPTSLFQEAPSAEAYRTGEATKVFLSDKSSSVANTHICCFAGTRQLAPEHVVYTDTFKFWFRYTYNALWR